MSDISPVYLYAGRHKENLLLEPELFAILGGVIGVQDSRDIIGLAALQHCLVLVPYPGIGLSYA